MKIYHSYHNTGGSHLAEFALTSKGWFYRWRWAPDEWKPLNKMKATEDGSGQLWATYEGTCDGKPYTFTHRFVPCTKTTKWDGCKSYPPLPGDEPPTVRTDSNNKALPDPGGDKHEGRALSLSDLLSHNAPEGTTKADVPAVPEGLPKA